VAAPIKGTQGNNPAINGTAGNDKLQGKAGNDVWAPPTLNQRVQGSNPCTPTTISKT